MIRRFLFQILFVLFILQPGSSNAQTPGRWPGSADQPAEFIGDYNAYITTNLVYPDSAYANKIEGRVLVEFIVGKDGQCKEFRIATHTHPLLNTEALRVLGSMPKWRPAIMNGKPVETYFTQPVTFRIPKTN